MVFPRIGTCHVGTVYGAEIHLFPVGGVDGKAGWHGDVLGHFFPPVRRFIPAL